MAGKKEKKIKLQHPDRSTDPSHQTLLDIAEQRGLLKDHDGDEEEVLVGRLGDSLLWSISLTMLHLTLDFLVTHQYAQDISWPTICARTAQAFPIIFALFYVFHPHPSPNLLLPQLPPKIQPFLHQLFFFMGSVAAGCHLIYITNEHGYYAVMKRAPPLGCLWIWSVIELDVFWATGSLICCGTFLKYSGYSIMN